MKPIGVLIVLGLLASASAFPEPYGGGRPRRPIAPAANQIPQQLDVSLQSFEIRDSLFSLPADEKTPMAVFVASPPALPLQNTEDLISFPNFENLKLETNLEVSAPAPVEISPPASLFEALEEGPVFFENFVENENVVEKFNQAEAEAISFSVVGQLPIEELFIIETAAVEPKETVPEEVVFIVEEDPVNDVTIIEEVDLNFDLPSQFVAVQEVADDIAPPKHSINIPVSNVIPPSSGFSAVKERDIISHSAASTSFVTPMSIADLPLGVNTPLDMPMMPHIPEMRDEGPARIPETIYEAPAETIKETETILPYGKPGENTVCPLCVKWTSSGLSFDPHGEPPPNAIFWGDLPEAETPNNSYGPPPPALPILPTRSAYGPPSAAPLAPPPAGIFGPVKSEDVLLSAEEIANQPPPAAPTVPFHVVNAFGLQNYAGSGHPVSTHPVRANHVKKPFKISNFLYNIFLKG